MIRLTEDEGRALLQKRQARQAVAVPRAGKRNKFHAIKTQVDGQTFDSRLEASRYLALKQLQSAGEISDLETQVVYRLEVNRTLICKYIADFRYLDAKGVQHVEDTKSEKTAKLPQYVIKRKLMLACHGIAIEEIGVQKKAKKRRSH